MKFILGILLTSIMVFLSATGYAFTCSVATTPVSFGGYNVFSTSPLDSTGTITLSCSNPAQQPIQVTVSIGTGASGSFNPRQMQLASGSDRMNYYLFLDPSHTIIWGDGTGGTSTFTSTIIRNPNLTATVYGRVPAQQNLSGGSYSDTLLVTVTW
jgi:spore coat protein U-like protein